MKPQPVAMATFWREKKKRGDFSIFIAENVPTEKGILVIWMKKVFRS